MKIETLLLTLLVYAMSAAVAWGEDVADVTQMRPDSPDVGAVTVQPTKNGYAVIDTASLKNLLDTEPADVVVVDARNPEEYQEVHIKDAINVPQKKFEEYAHLLPEDRSARIIFYATALNAARAKRRLKKPVRWAILV